jgi:hypothetical protein
MKLNLIAPIVGALCAAPFAAMVAAQPTGPDTLPDPGTGSGTGAGSAVDDGSATGSGTVIDDPNIGPDEPTDGDGTGSAPNLADDLGIAPEIFTARLYGYIDARWEKSQAQPALDEMGNTIGVKQAAEFDIPNFNVMLQGTVYGKYRYYVNLIAPGSGSPTEDATLDLRNAWVEFPIYRDFFNFRIGKLYRRFGIYNEILDAVPTFIGIEPPEMFDGDHLMLTRTTNAMLHGTLVSEGTALTYSLMTGNDERAGPEIPFSADLRFDFADKFMIGASYYTSNGPAAPTTDVGGGPPLGGVAQWMAEDRFQVYAVFAEMTTKGLTLQAEYTRARHDAERDPDRTFALLDADLFPFQADRFGLGDMDPMPEDVIVPVTYDVVAAYGRVGYEIPIVGSWTLIPYAQFDYYTNPEIINNEDFGGDNEAGLSDDGKIYKYTAGVVAHPVRFVAIKLDGSAHGATFNGEYFNYFEVRSSFSLYWELGDGE